MIGLLFYLLERLSIRQDYASSEEISLPTDEFDCSRTLAHMVLFPHDDAIVQLVGEGRYARWMDDQNIAVGSKAEGLTVLKEVGRSLSRLHLTPNGHKTKILSLNEARRHFHLDINRRLDKSEELEKKAHASLAAKRRFRLHLRQTWQIARRREEVGEFGKVLKRLYRLAGRAELKFLRRRSVNDILQDPALVTRVCDYYRCTGTVAQYLEFVDRLINNPEQVYPDVNLAVVESLLRLEPHGSELLRLRAVTKRVLRRQFTMPGSKDCATTATLLALRVGNASVRRLLSRLIEDRGHRSLVRAAAFVYASESTAAFIDVRRVASTVLRNHLSTFVRLIAEIQKYPEVPNRYKNRLRLSDDSVAGIKYADMRIILMARLLLLSRRAQVRNWVLNWRDETIRHSNISRYDKNLLRRLLH